MLAGAAPLQPGAEGVFVSVVVPMLNAERTLGACLEALLAQDHDKANHEIILVDNGSNDRSLQIARTFESVTLLEQPIRGSYCARNLGIGRARGDIIAFTDSDCVPERSWIREIAGAMSDPRLELLCGRRRAGSASPLLASIVEYENTRANFVLESLEEELYYGYTNNMAVRKQLFDSLGPFEERPRGADTRFVRKVAEERTCAAIRYLPSAVVTHLELDSLSIYYKKVFIYGRHRLLGGEPVLRWRPFRFDERRMVFRRTVQAGGYSRAHSAGLAAALGVGLLAWVLGGMSARLR